MWAFVLWAFVRVSFCPNTRITAVASSISVSYKPVCELWICLTSLFRCDVQVTLPIPANPVILKKAAAAQAAKEQKEAKEAKAKEKAAAAASAGDDAPKEEKPKEEKPKQEEKPKEEKKDEKPKEGEDEEEKPKEAALPASWLKPVKWFMGQFAKENGKLQTT